MRFLALLILMIAQSTLTGDELVVLDAKGQERNRKGTIVDIRGEKLTLELPTGRQSTIPLDRVVRLEADWSSLHSRADEKFAERDYKEAISLYGKAYQAEDRDWVKRRILARVVWCYRNTNQYADACRIFARLVTDDPDTPDFEAIPLTWPMKACPNNVRGVVGKWLRPTESAAKRLMAASWLLVNDRQEAISTLRELGKHPSQNVRSLAIGQLWRQELLTLKEPRLQWWQQHVAESPPRLRGGAYYLLGMSLAKFDRDDEATLAFLRVPILFSEDVSLSQRCLAEAASLLKEQGRPQEVISVLQQAVELNPDSEFGREARNQLNGLFN